MRDFSMHVLDIVQNSLRANATEIFVLVTQSHQTNEFFFQVEDNGDGMSEELIEDLLNPFKTTRETRDVGLGIPLLQQTVANSEGDVTIESAVGKGTTLTATMKLSHIDRPPLGDLANAYYMLVVTNPDVHFSLVYQVDGEHYFFDTEVIKEELDGVSFTHPSIMNWLEKEITRGIHQVNKDWRDSHRL